jgi:hypothetical protein
MIPSPLTRNAMPEITLKAIEELLDDKLGALEKRIVKRIDESQEELARMVAEGFEDVQRRLGVQQLIQAHERKFHQLEEALHIKL